MFKKMFSPKTFFAGNTFFRTIACTTRTANSNKCIRRYVRTYECNVYMESITCVLGVHCNGIHSLTRARTHTV